MQATTIRHESAWQQFARAWRRRQSYANMLYILASFPLGLTYFILLVTLISVGAGLAILGIGLVILAATIFGWRALGAFERDLTVWWLGIDIAPFFPPANLQPQRTIARRITDWIADGMTWKSLAYLIVKFFFGVLGFSLVITLFSLTLSLLLAPVVYLADVALASGNVGGAVTLFGSNGTIFWVSTSGNFDLSSFLQLLPLPLAGVICGVLFLNFVNVITYLWGIFARAMLGRSDVELRLAQAQVQAVRAEAQAARADQSRRELIVNVSHELRTPIATIRGHVESLRLATDEGTTVPGELNQYLGIVEREADRLSDLVDDLLSLARADSGELRLEISAVDPVGVLQEVYEGLAPLAWRDREVKLVREIPPSLPPVLADRQRLAQVLLNLARNAILYTPAGGIVSLGVERVDPTTLTLVVADTGIGIAPEDLEHVFERFYRADASRSRGSGGFGLGLAIVRDLVQAMGGTIAVASTVGGGSRFRVTLRLAAQPVSR